MRFKSSNLLGIILSGVAGIIVAFVLRGQLGIIMCISMTVLLFPIWTIIIYGVFNKLYKINREYKKIIPICIVYLIFTYLFFTLFCIFSFS